MRRTTMTPAAAAAPVMKSLETSAPASRGMAVMMPRRVERRQIVVRSGWAGG